MSLAPELRSHAHLVCTLYKKALRLIEAHYVHRHVIRYHQVLLRARFDYNRCVPDPKDARTLYWLGVDELFKKQHPIPCMKFARSVGIAAGVAHGRIVEPPDWVMDYWHPLEKAQYPSYFKTRECRKSEYIDMWQNDKLY